MSTATAVATTKTPTLAKSANGRTERFHVNAVEVEGIVVKVWTRSAARRNGQADDSASPDVYARLAIYDRQAEELPSHNGDGGGHHDLPRRQAHYVTIHLPRGRAHDGVPVSLSAKDKVRVTGFIREVPYRESLRHILVRAKQIDRIQDGDDEIMVQRIATYVVVQTLMRFGE